MKQLTTKILLAVACVAMAVPIGAQQKDKTKPAATDKKQKPKPRPIPVYLGRSDMFEGRISKGIFDSLVKQGLTAKDSAGKIYRVTGFAFNYAERNLYEDSVGNPLLLTDYLSEYCFGDTLTPFLKANIPERSKAGDTVYFDQVMVKAPEGYAAHGRPMKFVITR
jgi:hypothetical protein